MRRQRRPRPCPMEATRPIAAWGGSLPLDSILMELGLTVPSTWPGRFWNGVPISTTSTDKEAVPAERKRSARSVAVRGVLAGIWLAAQQGSVTTRAGATLALASGYSLARS